MFFFRKKGETRGGAAFFEGFAGNGFGIGCQCLTAGNALALVPTSAPPWLPPAAQGAAPPRLAAAAQSAAVEALCGGFGPGGAFGGVFGAVATLKLMTLAGPDHGAGAGAPLLAEPGLSGVRDVAGVAQGGKRSRRPVHGRTGRRRGRPRGPVVQVLED